MADSVRTKIRKALEYGLQNITTSAGFPLTFGSVFLDDAKSVQQMVNYPAVNCVFQTETYLNGIQGSGGAGLLIKKLPVRVEVYIQNINDPLSEELKAVAAIEKYIGGNCWLQNAGGDSTVNGVARVTGSSVRGMQVNAPEGLAVIDFEITYVCNVLDPESRSMATAAPSFDAGVPAVTVSRQQALYDAFLLNLRTLTTGNGYRNTVKRVYRLDTAPETINEYPSITVMRGPETYADSQSNSYQDGRSRKQSDFTVIAFVYNVNDLLTSRETILADMEQLFMNKFTIPDADGRRTCTECMLVQNEFLGMEVNKPIGIVSLQVRAFYMQERSDPAQLQMV